MAKLDKALSLAKEGFNIIQLCPNEKKPLRKGWQNLATNNADTIKEWWTSCPDANIGIKTGGKLIVVDVDNKDGKNGTAVLAEWETVNGKLPPTRTVKTPNGGYHYYYKTDGRPLKTDTDIIFKGCGIDTRGDRGQIVAPGSTINGKEYVTDDSQPLRIAEANESVYLLCEKRTIAERFILPETINQGERDETLFKYACSLQAAGCPDDEIYKRVRETNTEKCKPPLSEKEVDIKVKSALRYPKGKAKPTVGGLKLNPQNGLIVAKTKDNPYRDIAAHIIKKCDIVMLGEELRVHKEGRFYELYTPEKNETVLIKNLDNSNNNFRREVYQYIKQLAPRKEPTKGYIPFLNCLYDYKKEDTAEYAEEMYFTKYIPHNLNMQANNSPILDDFLNAVTCGDNELLALLYDVFACCFYEGNPWEKTFYLDGEGGHGKSTFFELLKWIFGDKNVIDKDWDALAEPKGRYGIEDKFIIICNDINATYVKNPQAIKTLTSGEPQSVKKLYSDEYTVEFKGKIISSGNGIPKTGDKSTGWLRRLVLIPFEADFTANPDIFFKEKLRTEEVAEALILTAVKRIPKLLKDGFRTQPKRVQAKLGEYRLENDHVLQFVQERGIKFQGKDKATPLSTIYYAHYSTFCNMYGYQRLSLNPFSKRLNAVDGIKKYRPKGATTTEYYLET